MPGPPRVPPPASLRDRVDRLLQARTSDEWAEAVTLLVVCAAIVGVMGWLLLALAQPVGDPVTTAYASPPPRAARVGVPQVLLPPPPPLAEHGVRGASPRGVARPLGLGRPVHSDPCALPEQLREGFRAMSFWHRRERDPRCVD